jgi:nonribosomal peptide synthetase MxcG
MSSILDPASQPTGPEPTASDADAGTDAVGGLLTADEPEGWKPVHAAIREIAERRGSAIAIKAGARAISYRELLQAASALARRLRRGIPAGEIGFGVAVSAGDPLNVPVALLAVLIAGGYYVPVDPALPTARRRAILEDAGARLLVVDCDAAFAIGLVDNVVDLRDAIDDRPSDLPAPEVGPTAMAYVVYTSGSTGRPKGVEVEHGALSSFFVAMSRRLDYVEDDVCLSHTPPGFDGAIGEVVCTLGAGATLLIDRDAMLRSRTEVLERLTRDRVTMLSVPSALWHQWNPADWAAPILRSAVRIICLGTEAGSMPHYLEWTHLLGGRVRICNLYGPTESTVVMASFEARVGASPPGLQTIPLGTSHENARMHILDDTGLNAPAGTMGEICISGPCLARGYRNDPDLTAQRFVTGTIAGVDRLYRTGDLGRELPSGIVEFLGRADRQVKIRGHRIELEEVEATLLGHPDVVGAAALVDQVDAGAELCAAILKRDTAVRFEDLREFLAARLPAYMIPTRFVAIDQWPTTPLGKVDRGALLEHVRAASRLAEPATSGSGDLVAAAWASVLGRGPEHARHDFFDAGGDSLKLLRLLSALSADLGRELEVGLFLECPTPERLAEMLANQRTPPAT